MKAPSYLITITTLLLVWSCGTTSTPESASDDGLIRVSKQRDITLTSLDSAMVYDAIELSGIIGVPPENDFLVSSLFDGSVRSLHLLPGDEVAKGDLVLEIQDEAILVRQQQFLEAQAAFEFQRAEHERNTTLFAEEVISRKQFEQSQKALVAAESAFGSAQKTIELMGLSSEALAAGELSSTLRIYAPFSGTVSEIQCVQGQFISSNEPLMRLTKTDHLHIEFSVFESDLSKLVEGQPVRVALPGQDEYTLEGEIHRIGKTVEAETRTTPVHADFLNDEDQKRWAPGQYVSLSVLVDPSMALTLPESALSDLESSFYALRFVRETNEDYFFEKVFVKTAKKGNGRVEVLNINDLKTTDRFLESGVFELVNE